MQANYVRPTNAPGTPWHDATETLQTKCGAYIGRVRELRINKPRLTKRCTACVRKAAA